MQSGAGPRPFLVMFEYRRVSIASGRTLTVVRTGFAGVEIELRGVRLEKGRASSKRALPGLATRGINDPMTSAPVSILS
jgi:hypothetical protein